MFLHIGWLYKPVWSRLGPHSRSLLKIWRGCLIPALLSWSWALHYLPLLCWVLRSVRCGCCPVELRLRRTDPQRGNDKCFQEPWPQLDLSGKNWPRAHPERLLTGRNRCQLLRCPGPPSFILTPSCRGVPDSCL